MNNDNGELGREQRADGQDNQEAVAVENPDDAGLGILPGYVGVDDEDAVVKEPEKTPVDAATEAAKAAAAALAKANADSLAEDDIKKSQSKVSTEPNKKPSKVKDLQDRFAKNKKKPEPDKPHAGGNAHVAALDEGAHKFAKTMDAFRELGQNKDLRKMAYDAFHELLEGVMGPAKKSHTGLDEREEMLAKAAAAVKPDAEKAASPNPDDAPKEDLGGKIAAQENVDDDVKLDRANVHDIGILLELAQEQDVELVRPLADGGNHNPQVFRQGDDDVIEQQEGDEHPRPHV